MILLQISDNRAGLGVGANVPEPTTVQDKESKSQRMENVNPQRPQGMDYVVDNRLRLQGMNCINNAIGMIDKKFTYCVNLFSICS